MTDREWHDATLVGSPWEQQTNGERWRHRPVQLASKFDLIGLGDGPNGCLSPTIEHPWRDGPAPAIIEKDFL